MLGKGAVLACTVLAALAAQESAPASKPESRAAVEYTLDNGLRVRLVPVQLPGESAVILGIRGAGILSEPSGTPHVAHVSEHTIFHGTQFEDSVLAWFQEGRANAETLADFMYFDLYPGTVSTTLGLRIQNRRLVIPRFDPVIVKREAPKALSEVTALEETRSQGLDRLGKFAWSPFVQIAIHGAETIPFKSRTSAIEAADVAAFWSRTFAPNRAMITVVGDLDDRLAATLRAWPHLGDDLEAPKRLSESRPTLKPGSLRGSWDVASHQFFMAWPAPAPSDPAHPALALFAQILGQRLPYLPAITPLIRQPLAVYGDVGGLFAIQTPLKSPADGEALAAALRKALDSLAQDESTLRHLRGPAGMLRTSAGIVRGPMQYPPNLPRKIMAHANVELARMRATLAWDQSPEDYCARADKVTGDDINAAVKTWLAPEKATIVTIAGKE